MGLFTKSMINPLEEVKQLKSQGYSDYQVIDELKRKGVSLNQINDALAQTAIMMPENEPQNSTEPTDNFPTENPSNNESTKTNLGEELYSRVEEIADNIIDEKWELLVGEVKKIVEWK